MKIITVVGARPQFIKISRISNLLKEVGVDEVIIHSGQHFDKNMSDIFFEQMQIPVPKYNLDINQLQHGAMTGRMLEKIEAILLDEKPDFVVVYGDTNTTLAGALAAKKIHIPVAHVESGLRSYDEKMPEELNRVLTDNLSNLLFCPTEKAIANLHNEGFHMHKNKQIIYTGDVMYDAALYYKKMAVKPDVKDKSFNNQPFILATVHRQENTDDKTRLTEIFNAFHVLADTRKVILPLHPRTRKKLPPAILKDILAHKNIKILEPVGYLEMLWLLQNAYLVITDSGGLQKEAFFFKKKSIVLRENTEWKELVDNNLAVLTLAEKEEIIKTVKEIDINSFPDISLYGVGNASQLIVNTLLTM